MSDNYAIRRYHRQTMPVLGVNRNKKYLKLFLLLLLAGAAVVVYFVYSSGLLTDDNPRIAQQMVDRINLERQAAGLPPVHLDTSMSTSAMKTSQDVKFSQVTTGSLQSAGQAGAASTNLFIIPKISWAISGYDAQQQMFDALENNDKSFRANILNGNFRLLGVGVSGDGYNYFITTKWQ